MEDQGKTEVVNLTGSCFCRRLTYKLRLDSKDDARTSLCHCSNCKKAFGGAFGLTAKVPLQSFLYTKESGTPKIHSADNGSGSIIHREFCNTCGSYICEYGDAVKDNFRYIAVGSLDDPSALPPKGEFNCIEREKWMPEIPDVFHKQKIKE
ncbi:DUF636 domain protein [Trematosphaeria pertusa]|uniref:DUF636 domain protein n=1 Tax=Trematosphaeria pertusa TaxID=390896 RepID=A0A6A6INV4_9PLEO|nr:DUF636 domain protein [Trematosphaeria pertusa]KAF2252234.1 DUF636 domain protein [Trematosphaeria pertusa]